MESVLLKANLVNLSTGQYWLNFDGQKGMLDREGHGHKAVLYKSHFPATKAFTSKRHHCTHRLINHVYTKEAQSHSYHCPMTVGTIQPSIEIPPIGPHLLPFTKILGPWWGPTKPFCSYVNGVNGVCEWVGTVLTGGRDT